MRTKKGAVLPGAVMLCSLMLIVSVSVGFFVVQNALLNKTANVISNVELKLAKAHEQFVESDGDLSAITITNYTWEKYEKEGDTSVKALIGLTANSSIRFFSVYDFTNGEVLAYQTQKFSITIGENQFIFGDSTVFNKVVE